jgi:uncharacterized tellurite resistance protein B-like protein
MLPPRRRDLRLRRSASAVRATGRPTAFIDGRGGARRREEKCGHVQFVAKTDFRIWRDGKHPSSFEDSDYRLAAAALLIHTAAIDGSVSDAARDKLHILIKQRFNLDDGATDELVAEATEAEQKAIDLYQFTARLNRSLDEAGRARMVEMMWQIAFTDGGVTEFEDNLIWRAADLLGVSQGERIALREQVSALRTGDAKS